MDSRMSLGEVVKCKNGSYDIRAIVDGRYVVRHRNYKTGVETYLVWTQEERDTFDGRQGHVVGKIERNQQIYEKYLNGETYSNLAREYGISPGRVRDICAHQRRKERSAA